eukprot:SAG22_NODE_1356_length_4631_cov_2.105693_3_plen_278_part_00
MTVRSRPDVRPAFALDFARFSKALRSADERTGWKLAVGDVQASDMLMLTSFRAVEELVALPEQRAQLLRQQPRADWHSVEMAMQSGYGYLNGWQFAALVTDRAGSPIEPSRSFRERLAKSGAPPRGVLPAFEPAALMNMRRCGFSMQGSNGSDATWMGPTCAYNVDRMGALQSEPGARQPAGSERTTYLYGEQLAVVAGGGLLKTAVLPVADVTKSWHCIAGFTGADRAKYSRKTQKQLEAVAEPSGDGRSPWHPIILPYVPHGGVWWRGCQDEVLV